MVGPKYNPPAIPAAPAYKEALPESFKEGDGWKTARSPATGTLRGNWWEIFGDPELNQLEQQLTVDNQDLKAAEARFREARAMIRFNRASEFPTISTSPGISSERVSGNRPFFTTQPGASGDFTLPFDFSWEADLWGRVRRTVNAAREEAQATAADLETATSSASMPNSLTTTSKCARRIPQKKLLDDTVSSLYGCALRLTTTRYEGGASPKLDVTEAQTQLDAAQVADTDTGVLRAQYEHAIATLVGKAPADFGLTFAPIDLQVPLIPTGVPAQLLERRPDIAASGTANGGSQQANRSRIAKGSLLPFCHVECVKQGLEAVFSLSWFAWPSRLWAGRAYALSRHCSDLAGGLTPGNVGGGARGL